MKSIGAVKSGDAMSRRAVLAGGVYTCFGTLAVLSAAEGATAANAMQDGSKMNKEQLIRAYYGGWEKKDWSTVDNFLAGDFTFTSGAGDDHISKATFKTRCWDTQAKIIDQYKFERILTDANGADAFVIYVCRTKKGTSFRNVEYFRFSDSKISAIECYFGGAGYPSASDADKKQ